VAAMAQIGVTLILRLACVTFSPFKPLKSTMNRKNSRYKVDPYDVLNNVINLPIQTDCTIYKKRALSSR
jgi:hypothetical protein